MDIAEALDAAEAPAGEGEPIAEAEPVETETAEVETTEEPSETVEAEAEPAEAPSEPEQPRSAWDDTLPEAAFTPEALSKPEGVAAAAKLVEEKRVALFRQQRKLDGVDIRHKEKVRKFEETKREHLAEQANFRALAQEVHATINMARNGTAAQRIDALGRLFGGDGRKIYEEISMGILRDGKPVKKTPEYEALEAQVAEMRQLMAQQREHEQRQQLERERHQQQQFIQQRRQQLAILAGDAQQFPALAHFAGLGCTQEIVDYAAQIKKEHLDATGEVLDDGETMGRIERELAPSLAGRVASQPTSLGTPQKPGVKAQRSPGQRSVTPSVAGQSGGATRVLTEEERLEELARDPDLLAALF